MMTNYRLRTRKKRGGRFVVLSIFFVIILILGLIRPVWFERLLLIPLRPLTTLTTHLQKPFEGLRFVVESKLYLKDQNTKLNSQLQEQKAQNLVLQDQLLRLYTQVAIQQASTTQSVSGVQGFIIKRPPTTHHDQFLIDVSNQEVSVGDWVVYKGLYIGKISRVFGSMVIATLLSTPGEETVARLNHSIDVTIQGGGGLMMTIELPQDVPVMKNDLVSYSSEEILPIGTVKDIVINETTSFQEVFVGVPFTLQDITYVTIVENTHFTIE